MTPIIILSIESMLPSCRLLMNEDPSIRLTFSMLSYYFILDFWDTVRDLCSGRVDYWDFVVVNFTWRFSWPFRGLRRSGASSLPSYLFIGLEFYLLYSLIITLAYYQIEAYQSHHKLPILSCKSSISFLIYSIFLRLWSISSRISSYFGSFLPLLFSSLPFLFES